VRPDNVSIKVTPNGEFHITLRRERLSTSPWWAPWRWHREDVEFIRDCDRRYYWRYPSGHCLGWDDESTIAFLEKQVNAFKQRAKWAENL
jgi:hypothetical protein